MRALKWILPLAAALAVAAIVAGGTAMAEGDEDELGILGHKVSVVADFDKKDKTAKKGASEFECTALTGGANTNLDCDDPFPNNEPDIEVDPANPLHMVASSNDYGSCCDQYYTTFDGGASWSTGNMSTEKPGPLGPIGSDPVTVFDTKHDVTLHASLNFFVSKDFEETCNGDLVVSPSKDGGLNWEPTCRGRPGHRLRPRQDAVLQRQGMDRHRQQTGLEVLRPDVHHLDEVRVAQR